MKQRDWWKKSVVYQIYIQSFCDADGDGFGDLKGIIGKLDYLSELGVDVLWISPFYPSPRRDNGYDISDYEAIDSRCGTMEDFELLIAEAHKRKLKVIVDLVINHSSDKHEWFVESASSKDSPKRDFYIWKDGVSSEAPNNWGALFGGPAWTKLGPDGQYYLHLFCPQQPDLNWENKLVRDELYGMMRRWLDRGIDGFRMDVISLIAKPQDFADGEPGVSGYFDPRGRIAENPQVHEHIKEMRSKVLSHYDVMTVGEAAAVSLENACRLSNSGGSELDMVFQFEHMDLDGGESFKWTDRKINVGDLKRVMSKWQTGLEGKGWNALFWDNHDQPRMLSRLGDEGELRERSAKMLATCLHMLKGTPFIYQGDELGMTNMEFNSVSQLRDVESLNAFQKLVGSGKVGEKEMLRLISMKSRDTARTPMQWSDEVGAGFTSGNPWMSVNPNYKSINAKEQTGREDSVFNYYKKLIELRHTYEIIVSGLYRELETDDSRIFAYLRTLGKQKLLVCCNFSGEYIDYISHKELLGENVKTLLSNNESSTYLKNGRLAPYEALIILEN